MTAAPAIRPAIIRGWRPKTSLYSLNARVHWAKRKQLNDLAKTYAKVAILKAQWPLALLSGRYICTITIRQQLGRLPDGDNLQGCAKVLRDTVAQALGIDDGSDAVDWRYAVERGPDMVTIRLEELGCR